MIRLVRERGFRTALLSGAFSLCVIGLILYLASESPKEKWVVLGGDPGGKYDEVAQSLGRVMNGRDDFRAEVRTSSGSMENLELLANGEADLGLLQNDVAGEATVSSIAVLYEEALHLVVRKDLRSPAQLAGAVISIGTQGGGTEGIAVAALAQLGVAGEDVTWRKESLEEGLEALRTGKADCVCIVTGVGNAALAGFLTDEQFALLSPGKNLFANLRHSYPFIQATAIPQGAYPVGPGKGIPEETIQTVGTKVILACNPRTSPDDTYELARFLEGNKAGLAKAHPLFTQMDSPGPLLLQHPLHEGASLHYEREEPTFIQEWADTIALVFSLVAVAWGSALAIGRIYLRRLKDSLDEFFARIDEITSEMIEGVDSQRAWEIAKELHEIRRETTKKLIAEELAADDSFVIFQRQLHTAQQLVNESLRKSKAGQGDD